MGIHVVVGANGATGSVVCTELLASGHTVRAVSRSGRGAPPGVQAIAADATDTARMIEVCSGADAIYHCALPPMDAWLPTYVDLATSLIGAAGFVGARLVYADDTWMYGKVDGPMREDSPIRPAAYKGVLRALVAEMVTAAHVRGQTETVIGRAGELYGPRVASLVASNIFAAALNGRRAVWPGDPDLPITPTYIGDFGRALADLGQRAGVGGEVFHVPVAAPTTGRTLIAIAGRLAGTAPAVGRLTARQVRLLSPFVPLVREGGELLYQFERPFVLDDTKFRDLTGARATGWDDGIRETLGWFRADPKRARYRVLPRKFN